jgi:hypothetical protein
MTDEKPQVLGRKRVLSPLCPPQIPRGLPWDRNRAFSLRSYFVMALCFISFRLCLLELGLLAVFESCIKSIELNWFFLFIYVQVKATLVFTFPSLRKARLEVSLRCVFSDSVLSVLGTALHLVILYLQGGSNMTGTCAACSHTNQSRSYLNHLVLRIQMYGISWCTQRWECNGVENYPSYCYQIGDRGGTVVKVPCYKSEGRWFDSRRCHWNFSLT